MHAPTIFIPSSPQDLQRRLSLGLESAVAAAVAVVVMVVVVVVVLVVVVAAAIEIVMLLQDQFEGVEVIRSTQLADL